MEPMEALRVEVLAQPHQGRRLAWPALLVFMAWGLIGLAVLTQHADLLDHHQLMGGHTMFMAGHYTSMGGLHLPWIVALVAFLASWLIMTAAMMLPASLPIVARVARANHLRRRPRMAPALFLAGYAAIWTGFGLAAFLGDLLVMRLEDGWPWLAAHPWVVGAATLALAGAYEVTPLKTRCLAACHASAQAPRQTGGSGAGPAWRDGVHHGVRCVGSCGALMTIMFGTEVATVPLMAALTVVMLAERTVSYGRRLTPLVGIALILLAAVTWDWGT
jgi:predicted metal-binding membrane protein